MANLESIMAETNKSYDQSRNALNNQINAISGDLQAQKDRINAQYAQQGKNLDNQRNWQAQALVWPLLVMAALLAVRQR